MALNKRKISLDAAENGTTFHIAGMKFIVKQADTALSNKIDQMKSERGDLENKTKNLNRIVFKELVMGWTDVTDTKLAGYIVSDEFHKESEWHDIDGMKFHIKRMTISDAEAISNVGTNHGKINRFINLCLLGWEEVMLDEDGPVIPFSKSKANEIFNDPAYVEYAEKLQEFASAYSKYSVDTKDKNISFSDLNIQKYMVKADINQLTNEIVDYAVSKENYREERIKEDKDLLEK